MILFDALHVNRSGGEVLLDVLIDALRPHQENIHFLLDDRLSGKYDAHGLTHVTYLKASLLDRHRFYAKNRHRYGRIFCFSGIPPTVKTNGECLAYLQNSLLIEHPGWRQPTALKRTAQTLYMRLFGRHVNGWIVQTEHMRRVATRFFGLDTASIMVAPFFNDPIPSLPKVKHKGIHFLYIADGYAHKNHERLFVAFEALTKTHSDIVLHVTLADHFRHLKGLVTRLQDKGIPILDHGFVPYSEVFRLFAMADVQVYPSLTESLGIGLIESTQTGLPVLAAHRPYVFELIEPSLTFDPMDADSIRAAMETALSGPLSSPSLRIRSHLSELVGRIVAPIE
jgi:glycosyltransferase involved in cell wall biosynthesis